MAGELAEHAICIATNPRDSFLFLATAAYSCHLLSGILALFYLVFRTLSNINTRRNRIAVDITAIYWHFMDGRWIHLLLLRALNL